LGLPAARLATLQEGLAKLQAEGVVEGLKAAKAQHEQAHAQLKADMAAVTAALDDLLSANGLFPADVKGYIDPLLVRQTRLFVNEGRGLGAAKLAKLQEGLAKLRAEGVVEGLKAAKAAKAQRTTVERRQAAKPPPTKRQRTSTSEEQVAGGGGGGGGGSGSGGGDSNSGVGEAMSLDDRFQFGVDDQAADL
jgi:uncharacterized membrane protein YgcG